MRFRPTGNRQQPSSDRKPGFTAEIARRGSHPIQAGKRWVVERIHSWMNDHGKLRRRTERSGEAVDYPALPGFPLMDS